MAKSKSNLNLVALITFLTSILGIVMFFLPNISYKLLNSVDNASGFDIFAGVFGTDNAGVATTVFFADGNGLAYVVGILLLISIICLLVCAVMSCLKLVNVKCNYSLVKIIACIASLLLVVAMIFMFIRFGQIQVGALTIAYGFIVLLLSTIATAIVPLIIKK